MHLLENFTLARQLNDYAYPELAKQVEATLCDSVLTQDEWPALWVLYKNRTNPR
jgi:hypothetical protein